MATIILKAKVKLISEEMIEVGDRDMGDMEWKKGNQWTWRKMGIDANDISKVINHSPGICMIKEYNGEFTMIKEPFAIVYKKWSENTSYDLDLTDETAQEESIDEDEEE